jgi:antitoxin component YwqK of YwqJK toxin-antitoxin module
LISLPKDTETHFHQEDDLLYYRKTLFSGTLKSQTEEMLEEKQYHNGIRHGIQKTFFIQGNLKQATMFTNGLKNGRSIEYYECGSKKLNANYTDGDLDGISEEWCTGGVLIMRKTFYKGKLIAIRNN